MMLFSVLLHFWVYKWKTNPVIHTSTATFAREMICWLVSTMKIFSLSHALQSSGPEFSVTIVMSILLTK